MSGKGCWMNQVKTQHISFMLMSIRKATAMDRIISKGKLYALMAMDRGVSKKAFEEYLEILIASDEISIDGDDIIAKQIKEDLSKDFKEAGI